KYLERTERGVLSRLSKNAEFSWLVRRAYGVAGRGRLSLRGKPDSNKEVRWILAGLEASPLVMEPEVSILREVSTCGWIERGGALHWADPCLQDVDAHGSWQRTRPCPTEALDDWERADLRTSAQAAAEALVEAGYWGPFSVDAFEYEDENGAEAWNALGEINARFTMGWATAFGERGRELILG
ncbi:MAG: hypothetical protein KDB61_05315, partial [Planctomycetes bacterium]|nr:hypothetical protein [Planctomycetota bacterium]